ncbi:hypothetical protein EZV62_012603 [Acer yangbiense]|uniref:Maintenance of Photosystem II under High light 2 C-terminal domain-containing protein n=1 Tax=Acer yangbiense TaxID=1000413 RepID=A0A5C7HWA7_9ROSI|nr:hypothetical protein EZV62_012603 [Acer yangbiense]
MATPFLSTANTFLSSTTLSSFSSSSLVGLHKPHQTLCKAFSTESPSISPIEITKRSLSISFITGLVFTLAGDGGHVDANAAILEADDDDELMEKVKKDRKKRLERQGVINSSKQETGYLQDLVFKLSKVGQAIENKDLSIANSVLGGSTDTDWVQRANIAFTKLSSGPEEKTEVDTFNSSLASLISSVTKNDIESSKIAFVASASAFEKWTSLTGLVGKLKGL